MPQLWDSAKIGSMELQNRFVRSATWEGMAGENGSGTARLRDNWVELAKGEVGLIISGHAYVQPVGQASPYQLGIHKDDLVPGLREMTRAVHEQGGKIVAQLAHAGCQANASMTGLEPLGPSVFEVEGKAVCREIKPEEIAHTVEAFARAAKRARDAGFDGVQIHGAHGYLLSQFLSPFYNRRTDTYGGSLENRSRLLLEVYRAVREATGEDYPVLVKINSDDFLNEGLSVDESVSVAAALEREGMDAVEFSGGTIQSDKKQIPVRPGVADSPDDEVYYREAARTYKKKVRIPLILVGGIRSVDVAEHVVKEGIADFVSMSRPLICEPDLVKRWKAGDRAPSKCKSDNACFRPAMKGEGIYCVTLRRAEEKKKAT